MKKKILIFVPDGIGVRNYLYSDVLSYLKVKAEVVLLTNLPEAVIYEIEKIHGIKISYFRIPYYKEGVLEKFYRELENISRLRLYAKKLNNPTVIPKAWRTLNKYRKRRKNFAFYWSIKYISLFTGSWRAIRLLHDLHQRRVASSPYLELYSDLLEKVKPHILFCTHQRNVLASPLFEAARQMGIKTSTAIYSWDNLPKARLPFRADKYFVWSDYMREELLYYYPDIVKEKIAVTGTPQFEFYRKKEFLESREEFCTKHGIDPDRRIICYSGGDQLTSPYDQVYLEDLALETAKLPDSIRPQILLRRAPVDMSDRYNDVLKKYGDSIYAVDPIWYQKASQIEDWQMIYPTHEDVKLLVNIAFHCELVYNVGSTMAHDYSMFNRPACYINYNLDNMNGYDVNAIYEFQHFKSMPSLEAVLWINHKDEISPKVVQAINQPDEVATARIKWLKKIVKHPVEVSSKLISYELIND